MNAKLLIGLFLSAMVGECLAAPRIACKEAVYDFGTAENSKSIEHQFMIANEGDAPLQIGQLRGCCGATSTIADKTIPPGSNTVLKVTFSLAGRGGKQNKSFYVGSNDPKEPYLQLQLVGSAVQALEVMPAFVDFGVIEKDAVTNATITILCRGGINLRITNTVADVGFVSSYTGPDGNNSWRVDIKTASLPLGVNRGKVTIFTDHKDYPKVEIPLVVSVASDLVVVPKEIVVTAAEGKPEPVARYLAMRSRSGRAFKILQVIPPESEIKGSSEVMPSGGWRITLNNIMPFEDLNGRDLVITTDHPQMPKITVPFVVNHGNAK